MEENNKMVRLDRNLTGTSNIFSQFGNRVNIVTSLYVYFCENAKRDIFGLFRLDPEEFRISMGYKSRSTLFEKVEKPFQLSAFDSPAKLQKEKQRLVKQNEEVFDSVLGDALYMMLSMNLVLKNGRAYVGGGEYINVTGHQIIKELRIYKNPSKKNKIYYDVRLNEDLLNNLKFFFDHINKQAFIACRDQNLQNLYFFITSLREYCISNNKTGLPNFDTLCSCANITVTDPSDRKKKLKVKINNLLKLEPALDFKFSFIKRDGDQYAYQPQFIFHSTDETRLRKAILINNEKLDYVVNDIDKKLIELFKSRYSKQFDLSDPMEFDSKFSDWKLHLVSDKDDKMKILYSVVKDYFPKSYPKWISYPEGSGSTKEKVYQSFFVSNAILSKGLF